MTDYTKELLARFKSLFSKLSNDVHYYFIGIQSEDFNQIVNKLSCLDVVSLPEPKQLLTDNNDVIVLIIHSKLLQNDHVNDWLIKLAALSQNNQRLILAEWESDGLAQQNIFRSINGYPFMNRWSKKLHDLLENTKKVRLVSDVGTDVSFRLKPGRKVFVEDNFSEYCDHIVQFPGGEVFVAPIEYEAEGALIVPYRAFGLKRLKGFVEIILEKGRILDVHAANNKKLTEKLKQTLRIGEALCEFGIGINPSVIYEDAFPWVEKSLGSIHLGFGNNTHFEGMHSSDIHYDITLENVDVFLDQKHFFIGRGEIEQK